MKIILQIVSIGCLSAISLGAVWGQQSPVLPPSLTPPSPAGPRINGPGIFGVRPGSPFLYAIPATGERPMAFAADNLPFGLALDSATGRITGRAPEAGAYAVVLHARNAKGSADRKFRIVVGDEIALTPAMGWNSWNCWAGNVDQDKVLRSARALVSSGLAQHGWTYVNIDDTWQEQRAGDDHALQANKKFPDMKGLCDTLHGMGLKAGIYSTPWITSYAKFPGGSSDDADGHWSAAANATSGSRLGAHSFASADARQWAAWGFDYLKYDWNPNRAPETREMAEALRASGRDIVLSLSNNAPFEEAKALAPLANSWRTTGDITDTWASMSGIGFSQDRWAPYAKPGHWNDPDMLVVGWVGWGNPHPSKLTPDEQYTHIGLWCLLSAPLLIGSDLEKIDAFTYGLLSNDEVLAIDQDALGKPATRVAGDAAAATDVYAKRLEDGSWAVGLFNRGAAAATVRAAWSDLGLARKQHVRDLWRQQDLGEFADGFAAEVAPHGVVLVRVSSPSPSPRP